MTFDPYKTLGIRRNATTDAIRRAYRKLAKTAHPDHNPGVDGAAERFRAIRLAYEVLSDPDRRARFDEDGTTDEPKPDRSLAEIMDVLTPLLGSIIHQVIEQGGKIDEENVVEHLRTGLELGKQQLTKQRNSLTKLKAAHEKALSRFTVDGDGENLLAAASRFHLAQIEIQLKRADVEQARISKVRDYLKTCRYTHIQRVVKASMGWSFGSATASSTWGG